MPIAPNVEMKTKPIDEQLAHALDITLNAVPEKRDPPARILEYFNTQRFMLTKNPNNIELMFVSRNPVKQDRKKSTDQVH